MTSDRRQFPRVTQPFKMRYRISDELGASWYAATIINLSAGGMRIRSADAIPPEAALEIEIQLPTDQRPLMLCGRVMWDHVQAGGAVEYGVAFLDLAPAQQVQIDRLVQFLHKSKPGPPPPP